MNGKYMKSCSTTLIMKNIHIKTTMSYHSTIVGLLLSKNNKKITSTAENVEKLAPSTICRNVKWCFGKQYKGFSKKIKYRTTIQFSTATSGYISKTNEIRFLKRYLYSHIHCITIHNSQDMGRN